ncbi:MAG TPA: M42 family metallopeptidase [Clostridiaceae bacterium]|nr:M42 family metallopeptidase [Clostridiaceae bacterium]
MQILKELTELNGVSGNEEAVRDYIKNRITPYTDGIYVDALGNLIAYKKGKSSNIKVMLSAHMDEVGFMVTGYTDTGLLKFTNIGGVDERILPGKAVLVGKDNIPGVISAKAIHLQEKEKFKRNWKMKNLYIDIGAEKKEEAEKVAPLGEYIAFKSEFQEFGKNCVKAKALDDRVGCAILMEALKETYDFNLYACFTVQEEIGLRGAETAAYTVKPDIALVFEGTTCSDVPETDKHLHSTRLGKGAVITIIDGSSYADKDLVNYIYNIAKDKNIPVQFKETATGGNDAGKIQRTRAGVKVAIISVPCRYIHSPVSLMAKSDFESAMKLAVETLKDMSSNGDNLKKLLKEDK